MTKRVFFHIGLPKAASTTLQEFCSGNVAPLRAQGIDYIIDPSICFNGINVGPVALSLMEDPPSLSMAAARSHPSLIPFEEMGVRCVDLIRKSPLPTVLLSSEDFIHVSPMAWTIFLNTLQAYDVRLVVYIRDMASYLCSNWAQHIEDYMDFNMPLAEFIETGRGIEGIVDPFGCILKLGDEIGDDRILIRPLDPSQWPNQSATSDLLATIGGNTNGKFEPQKPTNISLNRPMTDLLAHTNGMQMEPVQKSMLRLLVMYAQPPTKPSIVSSLEDQEIDTIVERYASGYSELCSRFGTVLSSAYPRCYGQARPAYRPEAIHNSELWGHCIQELYQLVHKT